MAYKEDGGYADCYFTDVVGRVSHEQFVAAFYTTAVFKIERSILKWVVSRPSSDAQAAQLAAGVVDQFAAWQVEQRGPDQLLLTDFRGSTRSWLMVAPITINNEVGTRLYFGSAVVPVKDRNTNQAKLGLIFKALLGFHKIYSVVLLRAAKTRLLTLARR